MALHGYEGTGIFTFYTSLSFYITVYTCPRRSLGTARSRKGALEKDGRERLRKTEASDLCHLPILNLNEKFGAKINYDIVGVHHVKWRR
jgi:hypothetical protein